MILLGAFCFSAMFIVAAFADYIDGDEIYFDIKTEIQSLMNLGKVQHLSPHGGPGVGHKIIQYEGVDYAVSWVRHGVFSPNELKTTDIPADKWR
jgi:hypothetical protein